MITDHAMCGEGRQGGGQGPDDRGLGPGLEEEKGEGDDWVRTLKITITITVSMIICIIITIRIITTIPMSITIKMTMTMAIKIYHHFHNPN